MGRRKTDERNYQVTYEDLEPWVEQLNESHGVVCSVTINLEGLCSGLKPAVRVTGRRWKVGTEFTTVFEDWRTFELRAVGQVEHYVLHMLSTALLSLDNDKWRAERETDRLFD